MSPLVDMERANYVVVTGDREWPSSAEPVVESAILWTLEDGPIDGLVEGEARGLDRLSRTVAERLGVKVFPEPALAHGQWPWAGPARNKYMIFHYNPFQVLAFHDDLEGRSKGTKHCVELALKYDYPVRLYKTDGTYKDL